MLKKLILGSLFFLTPLGLWAAGNIEINQGGTGRIDIVSGAGGGVASLTLDEDVLPGHFNLGVTSPAQIENSTNTIFSPLLLYDASAVEYATATIRLKNYAGGTIKLDVYYSMRSATSGTVEFDASIMCITPGDSADLDTASYAATGTATETVPGTAGFLSKLTITPTGDSCAENDLMAISLFRDATDGTNDTATGDAEVRMVVAYE